MAQFTHSLYLGGGVVSILEYTSTEEKKKPDMVAHTCNPSTWELGGRADGL